MIVRFTIYRRISAHWERWTVIGAPGIELVREGRHASRIDGQLRELLRKAMAKLPAHEAHALVPALATRLEHVRVELTLTGPQGRRTISGRCPVIVEERRASEHGTLTIAYHPERKGEWVPLREHEPLADQITRLLQHTLRDVSLDDVRELFSTGRDRLHAIALSETLKIPKLPSKNKKPHLALGGEQKPVLSSLAVDRTRAVASLGPDALGVTRSPQREQLSALLCGAHKQSAVIVGESGVGKSTLLTQGIYDLLVSEDFPVHRNLDRVRHVHQLSARQLIAGMSYAGQWEQRCFDLLDEVREKRAILAISDLAAFGRTGRSNQSDRTLADVFREPIARGELIVLGELTPGELARLEEDAPAFASLFTKVRLAPATKEQTLIMMLARVRELEAERKVQIEPAAILRLLELTSSLSSGRALPGAALDALHKLAGERLERERTLSEQEVLAWMAAEVGLSSRMLEGARDDFRTVEERLTRRVLGQVRATQVAADVVLRVQTGLNDARRPYAALLFAGPTGTGKTELAKALAEELYASDERLVRFDMGEYTGPDALGRLLGDAHEPDGALTRAVAQRPFCVLLLDEIEKAHRAVFPILLQLLDEGRLTSAEGRTVDFRHTVVIMTSNLGARSAPPVGFAGGEDGATADALRAVEQFFAPELFNRIDAVVPFVPLARAHAARIVARELVALCRRPGLRDRHAFVITEPRAIEHMASEAFRSEDGARSLRRWLEDRVGSALAEIAAASAASSLRIVHLRASGDGFAIDEHPLAGAAALDARFALERMIGRPASEVRAALPSVLAQLDDIAESPELPRIAAHISHALQTGQHAAELFTLESLRAELTVLHDELAALLDAGDDALRESLDLHFVVQRAPFGGQAVTEVRSRARTLPPPTHARLSAMVARAHFLRRSVTRALLPGMHRVDLELLTVTPIGRDRGDTFLATLARAYADVHGQLDGFSVAQRDGVRSGSTLRELAQALEAGASSACLRMSGLCVLDFFGPEAGLHVLSPRAREPELVRVRVRPSPDDSPRMVVDALERARRAADDLDALVAPVVRVVRFEPAALGGLASAEIEDYPHAYVDELRVPDIAHALAPLWRIRMSREDL